MEESLSELLKFINPPHPHRGGVYKGPYSNQGHIGLKKKRKNNASEIDQLFATK